MTSPDQRVAGQTAVITGAARGFGQAFARALAERGAAVALVDLDIAAARAAADELTGEGYRALAVECDVSSEAAVEAAVAATAEVFGGIDILINNAALHSKKYNQPFVALGLAETRRMFDVDVIGPIICALACRPIMAARGGGVILNISSIAGYYNESPYGVAKLAVRGLTVAFASQFAADKIRVNAIAPGLMGTEVVKAELPPEMFEQFVNDKQLIKRGGEIQDIVSAMLFLCSDEASFITSETLKVSGGYPRGVG